MRFQHHPTSSYRRQAGIASSAVVRSPQVKDSGTGARRYFSEFPIGSNRCLATPVTFRTGKLPPFHPSQFRLWRGRTTARNVGRVGVVAGKGHGDGAPGKTTPRAPIPYYHPGCGNFSRRSRRSAIRGDAPLNQEVEPDLRGARELLDGSRFSKGMDVHYGTTLA